jgi:hypothetical protein
MLPATARPSELASEAAAVNGKAQKSPVLHKGAQLQGTGREELWKNRAKTWGRTPHRWENSSNQQC